MSRRRKARTGGRLHRGAKAGGCPSGKVRFRDHEQAVKALHRIRLGLRGDTEQLDPYECDWCAGWHLTSSKGTP